MIAGLQASWFSALSPAASWPTRPTIQTHFAQHWTARPACRSSHPSGSRAGKLPYDKQLYKSRSEIECTFNLLKQARRFATRYEKTLRNYAAVVALGCALLWLRV